MYRILKLYLRIDAFICFFENLIFMRSLAALYESEHYVIGVKGWPMHIIVAIARENMMRCCGDALALYV